MIATAARTYVRAHYVLLLAVITVALGWYALHEHDARIRRDALWQQGYKSLDSLWRVDAAKHAREMAKTDTVRQTVTRLLASVGADSGWRHDMVFVAGDSTPRYAVPIPTVIRQDSLNRACSLLAVQCAAERVAAIAERDDLKRENAQLLARPERSCATPSLLSAVLGAAAGAYFRSKLP